MKRPQLLTLFVLAIATSVLGDVGYDSSTWEGKYECNVLPTEIGWTQIVNGEILTNNFAKVSDGILTVNSHGIEKAPYWYRDDFKIDFAKGFTVEWKVKLIDAGGIAGAACNLFLANDLGYVDNDIAREHVFLSESSLAITTQDKFHVYRMVIKGEDAYLYFDNQPVPIANSKLVSRVGKEMLRFGGVSDADYQIDYIRWTADGAFSPSRCRDLVVSIDLYDEIYIRTLRSPSHELSEEQIRTMVKNFASNGVSTILLRVNAVGTLLYRTELAKYPRVFDAEEVRSLWGQYSYFNNKDMNDYIKKRSGAHKAINNILAKYNPPEVFIDQAHKLGLKLIVWLDIFDDWFIGRSADILKEKPYLQWTTRDQKTYYRGIMSYAWPESRDYRITQAKELLALGADGIHCSTSSHPRHLLLAEEDDAFGFERPVVQEYKKRYGIDILKEEGWDKEAWHAIKGDFMGQLYGELANLCHSQGKEFWVGLPLGDYHNISCKPYWSNRVVACYKQNWRQWVDQGIADVFIVGDYELVKNPKRSARYWAAKELGGYDDLFAWIANTYREYCRGKTKLYLFGHELPEDVSYFQDKVLAHDFDGVNFHEGMMFEGRYGLLKEVSQSFNHF